MKNVLEGCLFFTGLALSISDGAYFPIPNFIGIGLMIIFLIFIQKEV